MYVSKLRLQNFRCYDDFEIDFDKKLTVIVAENGQGKTAVLDALAIAFGAYLSAFKNVKARSIRDNDVRQVKDNRDNNLLQVLRMKSQYPVVISAEGNVCGEAIAWQRELNNFKGRTTVQNARAMTEYGKETVKKLQSENDAEVVLPVIAYYGTGRIWKDAKLSNKMETIGLERSTGYVDCLESTGSYEDVSRWIKYAVMSAAETDRVIAEKGLDAVNPYRELMTSVKEAIIKCIGSMGWTDIDYSFAQQCLVLTHEKHGVLPVDALSDGGRSVISMASDLAYRMARLNPDLGKNAVKETPGIVLIDEVDMHLHPQWQQTILCDLRNAFPKVQFIVTTHSPQVLSTVEADSIRALRWDGAKIDIYRPQFSLGAKSSWLLKDIQNVDARPQVLPVVRDLQRYLDLVTEDKWDTPEALELRQELDKWALGKEPALLRADMDIRMRAFRRKRHEKNI